MCCKPKTVTLAIAAFSTLINLSACGSLDKGASQHNKERRGGSPNTQSQPQTYFSRPESSTPTPNSTYLSELQEIPESSGTIEKGSAEVNGKQLVHSVMLEVSSGNETKTVEYNLGRAWRTLTATCGVSDNAPANAKVRFEAFGDGNRLFSEVLTLGQSKSMNLNLTNVLRLKLTTTLLTPDVSSTTGVWGDALLVK